MIRKVIIIFWLIFIDKMLFKYWFFYIDKFLNIKLRLDGVIGRGNLVWLVKC